MKRKTERLLRNILLFVDQQLDELAAQEDSPKEDSASELASTPIRRLRAKLDELALAIEFELQLDLIRTAGTRVHATGKAFGATTQPTAQRREGVGETPAAGVQKLSPFQMMVDQWFLDHPNIEYGDAEEHPLARRFPPR